MARVLCRIGCVSVWMVTKATSATCAGQRHSVLSAWILFKGAAFCNIHCSARVLNVAAGAV